MSYERLNLKNDDVLDETHIAHMEDGIENAGGAFVVNCNMENMTADKSASEVIEAITNGQNAIMVLNAGGMGYIAPCTLWLSDDDDSNVAYFSFTATLGGTIVLSLSLSDDKSVTMTQTPLQVESE